MVHGIFQMVILLQGFNQSVQMKMLQAQSCCVQAVIQSFYVECWRHMLCTSYQSKCVHGMLQTLIYKLSIKVCTIHGMFADTYVVYKLLSMCVHGMLQIHVVYNLLFKVCTYHMECWHSCCVQAVNRRCMHGM